VPTPFASAFALVYGIESSASRFWVEKKGGNPGQGRAVCVDAARHNRYSEQSDSSLRSSPRTPFGVRIVSFLAPTVSTLARPEVSQGTNTLRNCQTLQLDGQAFVSVH